VPKRLKRWSGCGSPKRYRSLRPGRKAFSVQAINGGIRGRLDTHRWRIISSSASAAANCGHVVITPRSGDGLSKIKALGISCRAARRKLRAWGKAGYRSPGPRGYRCRSQIPPRRSVCRRKGHRRPVISYISGT
jgi:hypothetical protein